MRRAFQVESKYQKWFHFTDAARPFESTCEYFGFSLNDEQSGRSQFVRKVLKDEHGEELVVYFKLYGYGRFRRALSRFFKPARSKTEKKNLEFFSQLGIPACDPVAQGECRAGWGLLVNCLLITKEVTSTKQLGVFLSELEESDEDEELKLNLRRQIIESIATSLRKTHDRHFYHTDLKWRNILVRRVGDKGEKIEVFWIDCPNGYFDRTRFLRRKHGVIKDIATLDHEAYLNCSEDERLYFLSVYSGFSLDSPELRKLADKVLFYRKQKGKRRPGY